MRWKKLQRVDCQIQASQHGRLSGQRGSRDESVNCQCVAAGGEMSSRKKVVMWYAKGVVSIAESGAEGSRIGDIMCHISHMGKVK